MLWRQGCHSKQRKRKPWPLFASVAWTSCCFSGIQNALCLAELCIPCLGDLVKWRKPNALRWTLSKTSIPPWASEAQASLLLGTVNRAAAWLCIIGLHIQLLFRVLRESISLSVAFINIHCNNIIMLPWGSVLQNPFWKTIAVLQIFWNHSQEFKTAQLAPFPSHPTSVHPSLQFSDFWILERLLYILTY